jgi:hypothetical protein
MSEDRLIRIEEKLDALATGQIALERNLRTDLLTELGAQIASTRSDILTEVGGQIASTRSGLQAQLEAVRDEVRLIAEGHVALDERMTSGFAGLRQEMVDQVAPIRLLLARHSNRLDDHEVRIKKVETR